MQTSSALTNRVLAAVGALVSLALPLVASLDLGDPAASTRGQLEREAEAERTLALAAWAARRAAAEPAGAASGAVLAWSTAARSGGLPWSENVVAESQPQARPELAAALAVARAEALRGDIPGARLTIERVLASRD